MRLLKKMLVMSDDRNILMNYNNVVMEKCVEKDCVVMVFISESTALATLDKDGIDYEEA